MSSFTKLQVGFFSKLCKNLYLLIAVFSYFHGFGEEPRNPQESIREKNHHLQT